MDRYLPILNRESYANKAPKKGLLLVLLFFCSLYQVLAQTQPVVTVRFANPQYSCTTNEYCLDVEFKSNTANQSLFGMNVRFFYDETVLGFKDFRNYANGYGAVIPNPPEIFTGGPTSGNALLGFPAGSPATFVNGAVQLTNANAPPIIISTTGWTKLYQICFTVDNPTGGNFCPTVVWDLISATSGPGLLAGDDGVVITLVDPSPLFDSSPAIENVVQYNWQYSGPGTAPYGAPNPTVCLNFACNPPFAHDDTPCTNEDTPVTFHSCGNDTDPANDLACSREER